MFIANGATVVADSPAINLLGSLVTWCVVFSIATVLVALLFKRIESAAGR